jgi:hypothetical protein
MSMENFNFITSDFYSAAFLRYSGLILIGINKSDSHRFRFVFEDTADRPRLIEDFFAGRAMTEPRKFIAAIKELKSLVYSDAI